MRPSPRALRDRGNTFFAPWSASAVRWSAGAMSLGYRFASLKFRAKMRPKLASESGLALMEMMATSVVLSMAMVGVILMFTTGRSLNVAQGDTRVAFYLAEQKIEQLRALGFAAI